MGVNEARILPENKRKNLIKNIKNVLTNIELYDNIYT